MRVGASLLFLGSLLGAGLVPSSAATGQAARLVNIDGIVVDAGRVPVASAELSLSQDGRAVGLVRSGPDGKFSFAGVPERPGEITVRRLGYQMRTIPVDIITVRAGNQLQLEIDAVAGDLAAVTVDASSGRLAEFYEHKAQRSTFGKFVDQAEIRQRKPMFTSELFRGVPGISVRAADITGNKIRIRNCQPTLWVDGQRMLDTELDEVASPSDVGGIAFFSSLAGVPPQYLDRMNRACGVIIVWTR
jgi:hypothetical protein